MIRKEITGLPKEPTNDLQTRDRELTLTTVNRKGLDFLMTLPLDK